MNGADPELRAYLERIGLGGDARVEEFCGFRGLEALAQLQMAHACTIPFENVDVLLHPTRGLPIDHASVHRKVVIGRRGGYCFEQNGLMLWALERLGFDARPLAGRVRWHAARDQLPPRSHLFCRVEVSGVPYLVDVGVGAASPTSPLRMDTESEQSTTHDVRRIVRGEGIHSGSWFHQVLHGGAWRDVCEFTGEPMPPIDRELANWWTSTSPASRFRQSLMVAIARPDGTRISMVNRELSHRDWRGGAVRTIEERTIASREDLHHALSHDFGIAIDGQPAIGIDGL